MRGINQQPAEPQPPDVTTQKDLAGLPFVEACRSFVPLVYGGPPLGLFCLRAELTSPGGPITLQDQLCRPTK